jgi:hypothetical protein
MVCAWFGHFRLVRRQRIDMLDVHAIGPFDGDLLGPALGVFDLPKEVAGRSDAADARALEARGELLSIRSQFGQRRNRSIEVPSPPEFGCDLVDRGLHDGRLATGDDVVADEQRRERAGEQSKYLLPFIVLGC